MNYLWKITKEAEEDERMHQNYNYRKGGKPYNDKYKSQKQRFNRGKRERSRSDSRNRDERNQKYENYQMQPKGYYPPKRYMQPQMMGMRGGFPPYYQPPQMIAKFMR